MVIRTGRGFVVNGVEEGEERTTASRYEAADIWREVWLAFNDLSGVRMLKVKAHMGFAFVLEGALSFAPWCGNAKADKWAKAVCREACLASPCSGVQSQWLKAASRHR